MTKHSRPENKVTIEFDTFDKDNQPMIIGTGDVPWNIAQEIVQLYGIDGLSKMSIEDYRKQLHKDRKNDLKPKNYVGWLENRMDLDTKKVLGGVGILDLKLKRYYSQLDQNEEVRNERPLFDPDTLEATPTPITSAPSKVQEVVREKILEERIEIRELPNTGTRKWKPGSRMQFVAIDKKTGQEITSIDIPEDFSSETKERLEKEAERILTIREVA